MTMMNLLREKNTMHKVQKKRIQINYRINWISQMRNKFKFMKKMNQVITPSKIIAVNTHKNMMKI